MNENELRYINGGQNYLTGQLPVRHAFAILAPAVFKVGPLGGVPVCLVAEDSENSKIAFRDMDTQPLSRRRSPIVALVLSIATPGLGQFYNGQFRRAAILVFLYLIAVLLLFTGFSRAFIGFAVIVTFWAGTYIYSVVQSPWYALKRKQIPIRRYQRSYIYIGVILCFQTLNVISVQMSSAIPIKTARIETVSMEPTLLPDEYFAVDKLAYVDKPIAQGELAVFSYPEQPGISYIHRCLATSGQTVAIRKRIPFVDGKQVPVPGCQFGASYPILPQDSVDAFIVPAGAGNADNYGPVVVPEGKCFMLGDNIANCLDSRYNGFVDRSAIAGKPLFVYWSSRWGRIGTPLQ